MTTKLWIVGQSKGESWEFQGVFSTKEAAIKACRTYLYFIAPVILNQELPDETIPSWNEAYYPLAIWDERTIKQS